MMKVAITGGRGFIGSELVRQHREAGDEVRVLSRQQSAETYVGDLCEESLDLVPFVDGVDVIYHCAGELQNPAIMRRLHVEGTRRLLDAARDKVGRWVQLSSVGTYGRHRTGLVTEATGEEPLGEYECTKTAADNLVRLSGIPHSIVRPSIVYGLQMSNRSLEQLIAMIARGLFVYVGTCGASANYVHVKGVVEALRLCANLDEALGETFIVSDCATLEDVVHTVADELGVAEPRLRLPEVPMRLVAWLAQAIPGSPLTIARIDALTTRVHYSDEKIRVRLGYKHPLTLEAGFRELVRGWSLSR